MEMPDVEREVRIVDQDIDGAELFPSGSRHGVYLTLLSHVGLKNDPAAAGFLDFCQNFRRSLFVLMIVDNDLCAEMRKLFCSSGADATARSGDERDLSFQRAT